MPTMMVTMMTVPMFESETVQDHDTSHDGHKAKLLPRRTRRRAAMEYMPTLMGDDRSHVDGHTRDAENTEAMDADLRPDAAATR